MAFCGRAPTHTRAALAHDRLSRMLEHTHTHLVKPDALVCLVCCLDPDFVEPSVREHRQLLDIGSLAVVCYCEREKKRVLRFGGLCA